MIALLLIKVMNIKQNQAEEKNKTPNDPDK
jgi:hypothetical protein